MSKSRGNVVDPWEVINAHGADALRWYLYTAAPVGADRRFSSELVGEVIRKFFLTLWNTYSFFVTYANIDGWLPDGAPQVQALSTLDRWILSELSLLVERVDKSLEEYDVTGAARPIARFVDDLSNWYVRRSRRRFWKSESDADKEAAYYTLYTCLTKLAGLLAPFTPFLADALYQNLVRSVRPDAPESVHLTGFPVADKGLVDMEIVQDTRLVMRLASLGHAARNVAGVKVRQPLAQAVVAVREAAEKESLQRVAGQLADELNVKEVVVLDDVMQVASYVVTAVPALLGKKYGARFPAVREALGALDPAAVALAAAQGEGVAVTVDGEELTLLPEEVAVQVEAKEGYALAEEAGYLAAVTTVLSRELVVEGLAREVVRRIQTMRKEADFRIEDTIKTYYQAEGELAEVFQTWGEYIRAETLSTELISGEPPEQAHAEAFQIAGQSLRLGVVR
jgi:isoleucyl-tRNA synthetase